MIESNKIFDFSFYLRVYKQWTGLNNNMFLFIKDGYNKLRLLMIVNIPQLMLKIRNKSIPKHNTLISIN